jgi:CBS domain-containing protein
MLVREIMTREVEVIPPKTTLQQAAQRMKQLDVGALPVSDGEGLAGVVTDRDITVVATAEGLDPAATVVEDVMTPDVVYCYDDQPIEQAANLMQEKQIRRLPVLDRAKHLVGIVSLGDVADKGEDELLSGQVLQQVSKPIESAKKDSTEPRQDIPTETHT